MGPHMDQGTQNLLIVFLFGLLVAFAVVLILFPSLERVRSMETLKPAVESLKGETEPEGELSPKGSSGPRALQVALRLLEPDERRVVEALVAADGTKLQKDISHELGLSRVKTHRVLVRLIKRGVVTAEKEFNTNRIELADWIKEG